MLKLKKKLHPQMRTDIKANFLHLDINNRIHLDSFMKITIIFNMVGQLQEVEIFLLNHKKDYKL